MPRHNLQLTEQPYQSGAFLVGKRGRDPFPLPQTQNPLQNSGTICFASARLLPRIPPLGSTIKLVILHSASESVENSWQYMKNG